MGISRQSEKKTLEIRVLIHPQREINNRDYREDKSLKSVHCVTVNACNLWPAIHVNIIM